MEMEKYDEAIRDFEQINKMERGKIKVQIFWESHKNVTKSSSFVEDYLVNFKRIISGRNLKFLRF